MLLNRLAKALMLPVSWMRLLSLIALSLFFINVGIDHFLRPDFYLNIMPPNLPLHSEAVYLSGFLRFSAGLGY
jgi:uncharacterized membrane protein